MNRSISWTPGKKRAQTYLPSQISLLRCNTGKSREYDKQACKDKSYPLDVCYCESQDERPDHAKNELEVSIDDVCEDGVILGVCTAHYRGKLPSGPMFVNTTPLPLMNCKALLTFSAFWTRIRGAWLYLPSDVWDMISYKRTNISLLHNSA